MSERTAGGARPAGPPQQSRPRRDYAQLGLAAFLALVGVVVLVTTSGLSADVADIDPIGPAVFPRVVAVGLIGCALVLVVATLRGSVPEPEEGEDVDLGQRPDWRTVALLVAAFVLLIATVDLLGWTISSALFFAACTTVLGNRHPVRDLLIGTALGLITFYGFYSGLGVPLPAGILDGIL